MLIRSLAVLALLAACNGGTQLLDRDQVVDRLSAKDLGRLDSPIADRRPTPSDGRADADPCARVAGPADRPRKVVVSHPFKSGGGKVGLFEVLDLSIDGKLSTSGQTFTLAAAATDGEIVFTPDGRIGVVVLEDGSLGVFRLDAAGPQVVHAGFQGKFYASALTLAPDGQRLYVLDSEWRNIGGGIYSVKIGCDGTLTDEGLVAASKLPYAMLLLAATAPAQAVVVAKDILSSTAKTEVHLVNLTPTPAWVSGVDAFGDEEAIVSSAALTADGRYVLAADASIFSSTGSRVAVVEVLATGTLRAAQVLTGLKDPAAVITSPHNDTALVVGCEANKITVLDYNPASTTTPFSVRGAVTTSTSPQLPSTAVMIRRGALTGRVIIAENVSLRQLQLAKGGAVTETQLLSLGSGVTAIPGALGVQP